MGKRAHLAEENKLIGRLSIRDDLMCSKSARGPWIEGELLQDFKRRQKQINEQKKELERMRKELRAEMKNSRKARKQDNNNDENSSEGFQKPQAPVVDAY